MRAAERSDLILGGVTIAFACLALFVVIPTGVENPGQINVMALGPSFWPSVIAVFICSMGILVALQAYRSHRNRKSSEADEPANFAPTRWIGALVLLAGYYLLLDILGMVVTSALALLTLMLLGGERRPVLIVAITVILPVALFLFFRYVANVSIPMGIFGDWIS